MPSSNKPHLLVAGASGRLGGQVLALLAARDDVRVSAGTRTPETLANHAARGVEVRRTDFDDPATLEKAFVGIDRLLLISTDATGTPGKRIRQHRAAIGAAVVAGVKHIVYTSMPAPEQSAAVPFAPDHVATEQALRDSGLGYTVLRVAWYAENLTDLGLLPRVLAAGRWYTSAGEGRISYVPLADVARATAAALAAEDDQSHVYDITGQEAMSVPQIASAASEVFGTPLTVVQVSDDRLATELTALGVPAPCVPLVVITDANARAGNFDLATDTIERLTGTKPQSLQEFFATNKTAIQSVF